MSREFSKNAEMNRMSDLICDMTANGATEAELERVILYSAEVINSDKNGIDWRPLYEDYVIYELEDKYQPHPEEPENPNFIVFDEYHTTNNDPSSGRGEYLGGFNTREEAEAFVKQHDRPFSDIRIYERVNKGASV
jgi:hypothetical protein